MIPTPTRNWIFTANGSSSLNQSFYAKTSYNNNFPKSIALYMFKRTLVGFSSGPWTVTQSRDALGNWSNAGVDYWTSPTSFGDGGSSYTTNPWIVLRNSFAGVTTEILFSVSNAANGYNGKSWVLFNSTFAASVGGAQPVVPTTAMKWTSDPYTNEVLFFDSYQGWHRLHVMQAWDSVNSTVLGIRMACFEAGSCKGWGFLDKVENVPTGGTLWTYPVVGAWGGNSSSYPPSWSVISQTTNYCRLHAIDIAGPTNVMPIGTTRTNRGTPVSMLDSGRPHTLSGGYAMTPLSVCGFETPYFGKMGNIPDFWIGSNMCPNNIYYPQATPNLVQVGHFIWPWDPSVGAPQGT